MSQCAQCGAEFNCGMVDSVTAGADAPCWCTTLPALPGLASAGTCLCPACLRERIRMTEQGQEAPDRM